MGKLDNKKIIVTGGCRGIGRAIVEKCLQEGAYVAATYNSSSQNAKEMEDELDSMAGRLITAKMDVTNSKKVKEVMAELVKDLGGIDGLVNNAGITKDFLVMMMKDSDWDDVLKANLYGPFYTTKSVLLDMISQKHGNIVNITSVSGVIGVRGQANYCASKFGLVGFTKALAKETAYKNIRVNAVAPGYIETDMVAKLGHSADEIVNREGSFKRLGKAEEIANVVTFLLSDESSYMTGQVLVADGGII